FEYLHTGFPAEVWYAFKYGIALGLATRWRESITLLEQVRQRRPDLASVPAKIGFAYLQMKRMELAAQYFNEALMLDECEPHALYHLALIRYVEGRTDRALTYCARLRNSDADPELARDLARKLGLQVERAATRA